MSKVKHQTRKVIHDYRNDEINREQFKREIRSISNNFQGANWRSISLAAQKYLSDIESASDSRFDVESAIIEVFPRNKMNQTWANKTVERIYENE